MMGQQTEKTESQQHSAAALLYSLVCSALLSAALLCLPTASAFASHSVVGNSSSPSHELIWQTQPAVQTAFDTESDKLNDSPSFDTDAAAATRLTIGGPAVRLTGAIITAITQPPQATNCRQHHIRAPPTIS